MRARAHATDSKLKRALGYLSIAYVLLLAACSVALILIDHIQGDTRTELGCWRSFDFIHVTHCEGFMGAETLGFILNMPILLVYAPVLGGQVLIEGPIVSGPLLVLGLGLGLWAPIIYLLWQVRYRKRVFIALALAFAVPLVLMLQQTGAIF